MEGRIYIRIGFCCLIGIISGTSFGQIQNAHELYREASGYYTQGLIDSTLKTLSELIEDKAGFKTMNRNERRGVYRLAAQSAYFNEDVQLAEYYTRELMAIDPYYSFRNDDNLSFRQFINHSTVISKHQVGVRIGYTRNIPVLTKNYSALTPSYENHYRAYKYLDPYYYDPYYDYEYSENADYDLYGPEQFLNIGIQYEYNLNPRFTFGTELVFANRFATKVAFNWYDPIELNPNEYYIFMRYFELPVYGYYSFLSKRKVSPIIELGFVFRDFYPTWEHYFEKNKSATYGSYYVNEDIDLGALFFSDVFKFDVMAGAGVRAKLKRINFKLNIRYLPSFLNSDPFADLDQLKDIPENDNLYYIDDILLLKITNHLQASFSINFNLNYKAY